MSALLDTFFVATGSEPILSLASAAIINQVDAALMPAKYDNNLRCPFLLPGPGEVLNGWINGFIPDVVRDWVLGFHAIPIGVARDDAMTRVGKAAWDGVVKSKYPKLAIEQIIYSYYSGMIGRDEFNSLMKKYGFLKEQIPLLLKTMEPKFDATIISQWYLRGRKSDDGWISSIRKLYGCSEVDAKAVRSLTEFLPPPQDLLRFAVRDVYDPVAQKRLGLQEEFDLIKDIVPWAKALGIGTASITDPAGNIVSRDILKDYWMAHWQLMSPTQGYEALHKLRPNRLQRYSGIIPDLTPFDFGELNYLLKANDYVPAQRKWLAGISYHSFQKRDLRNLYNTGFIDDTELPEQLQDTGLLPADATTLAAWYKHEKNKKDEDDKEKEAKKKYGRLESQTLQAYNDGAISKSSAFDSLVGLGFDTETVQGDLDAIDVRINRTRVQAYVKMVRAEFFLGLYTPQDGYFQLIQGGLQNLRANQYIILWQRQLSKPRRIASINTVLDWYKRILISRDDASARLSNLGVSNAETLLYLEASDQDIQKRLVQEQAKQARTDRQQAEAADRLVRQAMAAHRSAKADIRSYSSIADMKRWYLKQIISQDKVIEIMQLLDVPQEDILNYLIEWGPV